MERGLTTPMLQRRNRQDLGDFKEEKILDNPKLLS